MPFLLGIAASLIAGALLWGATHLSALRYLTDNRGRNNPLAGTWHHYHLSRDARVGSAPLWIHHRDELRVSLLGRVHGQSHGEHVTPFEYQITGQVRGSLMRCWFTNRETREDAAYAVFPNLLARTSLVGFLIAEDFDKHWFVSPLIISRSELAAPERGQLAKGLGMLHPPAIRPSVAESPSGSDGGP